MDIFKIIGVVLLALILIIVLEKTNKEYSIMVTIISSIIILGLIIIKLDDVVSVLNNLAENAGINKEYLKVLLKVTGISYVVELAKNICVDAGSSSLATKVELLGKVSIVTLTIPIITSVIGVVINIV